MSNAIEKQTCVLCGQPVEITGFSLMTNEGVQQFCCAGCLSIYQLLNPDKTKSIITPLSTKTNED